MVAQTTELLSHHFSHDHPLEHTNLFPQTNTTCFGCNLTIIPGHYYYKCKTCSFYLHQVCHNMPKKVQHPCDPNHRLTLKSMPNNGPSKLDVKCKACEHNLSGFYYSCNKCDDYYHILCSAVPLSVKTPSHQHILKLEYEPPYDFQCDLCHKPCYNGWLYRCSICEFDVHLACAITNKGAQLLNHQMVPKSPRPTNINKKQELMELLTRGLTKGEEKMEEETHEMPQEDQQITSPPEDPSFISYQFSDACFSIDFAKSLLGCEDHSQPFSGLAQVKEAESPRNSTQNGNVFIVDQHKQKKQQSDVSTKSEPTPSPLHRSSLNGLKISVSGGIGSHIWVEIDPETEKSNGLGTGFRDKSVKARHLDRRKSTLDGVTLSGDQDGVSMLAKGAKRSDI